jgi:4-hydroxy-tetrahydrodipicolinate synthase
MSGIPAGDGRAHRPALAGVYPIVPTPFDPSGEVDEASVATLTAFMVRGQVDGLAVLGVMGEAQKLTDEERDRVVAAFRRALPADRALVVGTGGAATDPAVAASRRAVDLGADALLVGPPPIQNDDVLFGYYERVARSVEVPIVIHDYPPATGVLLSPALVARLHRDLPRVDYIKLEEAPTGPKMERLRALAGERLKVFGALGGLYALEELERGAVGLMTGFAYPELLVRLVRLYREGRVGEAADLFYAILPLIRFEFQPGLGVGLRKAILVRRGAIRAATVRHPGVLPDAVTLRQLERIEEYLRRRGVLEAEEPVA